MPRQIKKFQATATKGIIWARFYQENKRMATL